jgi:hypothetical protein
MEEVGCEQSRRLASQEGPPAGVDVAWRRANPAGGQDPPDRARADLVAETDQLSLDAAMPPTGILAGQPEDKVTYFIADRRATRPVGVSPMTAD